MNECCNIEWIVRQTYGQLLNYLKKQTGDNELAEDIAQDAMLKLVRAHIGNQALENPGAWLFRVAKNQLSDHYRKKEVVLAAGDDSFLPDATIAEGLPETMPEDMLPRMVSLLPAKYGEPLAMSDLYKIPGKDIAEQLGISLSAAKMRIRRARKMLLQLFQVCCEIEYSKSGGFAACTIKDSCRPLSAEQGRFSRP